MTSYKPYRSGLRLTELQDRLVNEIGCVDCYNDESIKEAINNVLHEASVKESTTEQLQSTVFDPHWPEGLESLKHYEFCCDDKGSDGNTWLKVFVAGDGDVHVSMQEWEDIREEGSRPDPLPSIRCRTSAGGGRHTRVRQALLWLAKAIQLDSGGK